MSTLVLDRARLAIRGEGSALALYEGGDRRGTIPLKLLERVVVQGSGIEINTGAILKLAEQGVSILFLSPRYARRVAILLGPAHNDGSIRLAQAARVADEEFRRAWCRHLVISKVTRQRGFIAKLRVLRPDRRKPLTDALTTLNGVCDSLSSKTGLSVETVRGFEGAAAAAYFRALATVFPPSLDFAGRNRRPPRDPVNACLSLAYTMLHFDAVRASHVAGLDPLLGFYHRPAHGRESLACDLIEPLRPVVDEWVWRLFADRVLRDEHFARYNGACLLGKTGRSRFYAAWEGFATMPRRYLRMRCARLARGLRELGETWLREWADENEEELE